MAVLPGENGTRPGSRPSPVPTVAYRSTGDLLVHLSLGRFRRPPISALPSGLQRDIRSSFGSYFERLPAGRRPAVPGRQCRRRQRRLPPLPVGNLLPNALYVHRTALESLDPLLRVFEGFSRAYLGEIEGADDQLHRHSGKVSYLAYPDFDADPHPALLRSIKLNPRTRRSLVREALAGSLRGAGALAGIAAGCGETQDRSVPHLAGRPDPDPPDRPGGAGRAAGRDGNDRHPGRMGGSPARAGLCPPRASAGPSR